MQRIEQIAAWLGSRYDLAVERLDPAPRGWTGETYVATVRRGNRVFVKIYPKERIPPTAAPALPVLAELHRLGLTWISQPIPTTSSALHEWLGNLFGGFLRILEDAGSQAAFSLLLVHSQNVIIVLKAG